MPDHSFFANLIWQIADLLRGPYRPPQYERVMLPMTVLRRFDCVLARTKPDVLAAYDRRGGLHGAALDARLNSAAGQCFHNHSPLDFEKLKGDPDNIALHLVSYIQGFSANVRCIFEFFDFEAEIEKMREANLLYLVVSKFCDVDLHPTSVPNEQMGHIFENLIRRFNELANETAGDHFTPREVIRLMVSILFTRWKKAEQRLFRDVFTEKDAEAEPVWKDGRENSYEPDTALRGFENVPLKDDVDAYFEREVRPHVPDAWMDRAKDKVGYEINFNRHFYFISMSLDFMQATATEDEIEKFGLQVGDVVITKDSESWDDIGVPALVRETADDLVCGYHLALLRPRRHQLTGAFLLRCLQAKPICVQLELAANGVTRFGLAKSEIGVVTLPVPPLSIQYAIADYLDRETARLNALVAEKERLLGLLAEKRRALITRAVTRGLDPKVPLRDSGIPWLGEIPTHWKVILLRFACYSIETGGTPSIDYVDDTSETSVDWFTPGDFGSDLFLAHVLWVHETPERTQFIGDVPPTVSGDERDGRPLAVFFSTNRAVPSERAPRKGVATGGIEAAFADAFLDRELRLGEFGDWLKVQESLCNKRVLTACEDAVKSFLPGYANLRLEDEGRPQLWIDLDSTTIPVRQLSDGERGILALVLDLTRRLAQANPNLTDPVSQAGAVVLIDEIDLHLHPKWQRQIVHKLTETFPRCQFIAATHSPQVVALVEPDQVHLLAPAGIIRPDRSRGMDSNWILRHLMEAEDRPEDAIAAIQSVENLIEEGTFEKAHTAISEAKKNGLDLPEWSVLEARIARLEILAE